MKKSDVSDQIYNSIHPEYRHLFFEDENNNHINISNTSVFIPESSDRQPNIITILYQLKQQMAKVDRLQNCKITNPKVYKEFNRITKTSPNGTKIYGHNIIFYSKEANDHLLSGTNNYIFILPLIMYNGDIEFIRIRFNIASNEIEILEFMNSTQVFFILNSLEAYDVIKMVKLHDIMNTFNSIAGIGSKEYKAREV